MMHHAVSPEYYRLKHQSDLQKNYRKSLTDARAHRQAGRFVDAGVCLHAAMASGAELHASLHQEAKGEYTANLANIANVTEQFQVRCLEGWTDSNEKEMDRLLNEAITASLQTRSAPRVSTQLNDLFIKSLQQESRLPSLKKVLLNKILAYQDSFTPGFPLVNTPKREAVLWSALIPGSVLREIFHMADAGVPLVGTSLGRGTFQEVIDALTKLQKNKTMDPLCQTTDSLAVDKTVLVTLRALQADSPKVFEHFIEKLNKHGSELFNALPADLRTAAPANGLSKTVAAVEPVVTVSADMAGPKLDELNLLLGI